VVRCPLRGFMRWCGVETAQYPRLLRRTASFVPTGVLQNHNTPNDSFGCRHPSARPCPSPPPPSGKCEKIKSSDTEHLLPTRGQTSAPFLSYTHQFEFRAVVWFSNCNNFWVAVISAKNHKRQSVTAIREKSQTPKVLTVILTLRNLTKLNLS